MNAVLSLLMLIALLWPFYLRPPGAFSAGFFVDGSASEMLQGEGLERTWMMYSGFAYTPTGTNVRNVAHSLLRRRVPPLASPEWAPTLARRQQKKWSGTLFQVPPVY